MTHTLYMKCLLAAMLGVIAHIVIVKIPSYKAKCDAANRKFSVLEYFRYDLLPILGTMITIALLMYVYDEWIGFGDWMIKKAKSLFAFIGFTGSTLLMAILGVADKKVTDLLGIKSVIADNTVGISATVQEAVRKADDRLLEKPTEKATLKFAQKSEVNGQL